MSKPIPVVLKKDLARSIRRGHPWLYRDAVDAPESIEDGALVEVRTKDRRPLAIGFWDTKSPIAVRVLDAGQRPGAIEGLVARRIAEALRARLARLDLTTTNAFRWVHGEADALPGLHIDTYAGIAVVRYDGGGARAFYHDMESQLRAVANGHVALGGLIDREQRGDAEERIVLENGARFIVDLAHAQKGGLFLDQRENRLFVAKRAKGLRVLNLFGYTGGFSVHAALAGAVRTDTVDLAKPAIETARRNFEANGLGAEAHGFYAEDAFEFLDGAAKRGDTWDIVISDPPSFAPRKSAVEGALRAYQRLHRMAASVTAPGGLLCAASCSSHVSKDAFLDSVESGLRQAGRRWQLETLRGAAFDHPVVASFPEGDYLKFAVGRVLTR